MHNQSLSFHKLSAGRQVKRLKTEAKILRRKNDNDRSHKYYLNHLAIKYGYESYDELYSIFIDGIHTWRDRGKSSCLTRVFDLNRSYFYVTMHGDFEYSYYSHFEGYDEEGYELRAPSLVKPEWIVKLVRESLKEPLYIIHNKEEQARWVWFWKGHALVDHITIQKLLISICQPKRSYSKPRLKDY